MTAPQNMPRSNIAAAFVNTRRDAEPAAEAVGHHGHA